MIGKVRQFRRKAENLVKSPFRKLQWARSVFASLPFDFLFLKLFSESWGDRFCDTLALSPGVYVKLCFTLRNRRKRKSIVFTEFIEKYVNREEAFNSVLLNKLTGIYSDIGWDFPILNDKINKFFSYKICRLSAVICWCFHQFQHIRKFT